VQIAPDETSLIWSYLELQGCADWSYLDLSAAHSSGIQRYLPISSGIRRHRETL